MSARVSPALLTLSSFALTCATVMNAYYHKKQFYPTVVYLTKSNASLAVLYVQALVFVLLAGRILKGIFFGRLRPAETERLMDRGWYALTETCLAFTVFRDDFSPSFVAQFTLLLFIKCFHWLGDDRVDYMERSPVIPVTYHVRMMSLIGLLSAVDSYFVSHAYFTTLLKGATSQIVFGFEYAILLTIIIHVAVKYILHTNDLRSAHPWEAKAVYLLYTELAVDGVRCVLYSVFLFVMIKLHTFPLFAIRPFYLTVKAFKKALWDVILSRRAIHAMQHMFPDVTAQELADGDPVCIICREEMVAAAGELAVPSGAAKRLPCGHRFHAACLRGWFQRQQTCPTCRMDILTPDGRARAPQPQQRPQQQQQAAEQPQQARGDGTQPEQRADGTAANQTPAADAGRTNAQQNNANQAAGQMPNFPGFMFRPPGGFNPAGWPFRGAAPTQSPGPSTSTGQPQTNMAGGMGIPMPNMGMPGMPLPGMGMGMGFGVMPPPPPPFPMPADLSSVQSLSAAELARMEGTERAAVIARIAHLRNLQLLLDCALLQLQQYTSLLGALAASPEMAAQVVSPTNGAAAATTGATEPAPTQPPADSPLDDTPQTSKPADSAEQNNAGSSTPPVDAEQEELRRKRLAFIEKTGGSSGGNSPGEQ